MPGLLGNWQPEQASMRDVYAHIYGPTSPTLGGSLGGGRGVVGAAGSLMDGLLGMSQKQKYNDEVYRRKLEYDIMQAIKQMDSQELARVAAGFERGPDRQAYIDAAQAEMSMRRPIHR